MGMVPMLPAAPATLALSRISLVPGAHVAADPGDPALMLVAAVTGPITLRYDAPMMVARAGSFQPEPIAAGVSFALAAGDSAVVPPMARGQIDNAGSAAAEMMIARVEPKAEGIVAGE
jgi:hypothetical protein